MKGYSREARFVFHIMLMLFIYLLMVIGIMVICKGVAYANIPPKVNAGSGWVILECTPESQNCLSSSMGISKVH